MKMNLKDIQIKKDKIIFDNEEYDNFGNLIETPKEKYLKVFEPGTIINYDNEYILMLPNNGYVALGYNIDLKINYIDYDWAKDPRIVEVFEPFKNQEQFNQWLKDFPEHEFTLNKHYNKKFFKS